MSTINTNSQSTFEQRWLPARLMWEDGVPRSKIAYYYAVSEKALTTRITKWRKQFGWFPPRTRG
jgi:hypothetical protein